jgi:hypothetical protein
MALKPTEVGLNKELNIIFKQIEEYIDNKLATEYDDKTDRVEIALPVFFVMLNKLAEKETAYIKVFTQFTKWLRSTYSDWVVYNTNPKESVLITSCEVDLRNWGIDTDINSQWPTLVFGTKM